MVKLTLIAVIAASMSASLFASTNACQSTTSTSILVANSQNAGAPIAAQGSATPDDFAGLDGAAVPGCSTVDLVFNNLTATSAVISGTGLAGVTNSGAYLSTESNQNLAAGTVDAVFSTVRGADNVQTDGDPNDGVNNWDAPRKADVAFTVDYQVTTTDNIRYFVLNLNGLVSGQGGGLAPTASVVQLCLGGSWSTSGPGATCSSGKVDTITLNNVALTYSLDLGAAFTTIGVQNNFQLNGGNAGNGAGPTYLTSFDESFGEETPEPSTFILMGAALASVAALRFRKRKQS
jgi:hypothetical protein